MERSSSKWRLNLITVALGLSFTQLTMAADVDAANTTEAAAVNEQNQKPKQDKEIEVITVTSQKRSQSVQEIGMALTAFDGDQLRDQGINSPMDIDKVVPNISMTNHSGVGMPILMIRGVGLQNFRINDSPTNSFYIDEVYQASIASAEFSMYDLERLEVLKGPQGGLYGRNAVGGAIQIISKKPVLDEDTSGFAEIGTGSYGLMTGEFGVNLPLADKTAARISGRIEKSDATETFSGLTGEHYGAKDRWALRGQVYHELSDELNVLFKVHGGVDKSEGPLARALGLYQNIGTASDLNPAYPGGLALAILAGFSGANPLCQSVLDGKGADPATCATLNGQTPNELGQTSDVYSSTQLPGLVYLDNAWQGASMIVEADFSGLTLTSISAYDTIDYGRFINSDATPSVYQDLDYHSDIKYWSQEFRLASPLNDSFNWIVGASISGDELSEDSTLFGAEGILPVAYGATEAIQNYDQETTGYAIYGHAEYALAEAVSLITELRYTDEEKTFKGDSDLRLVDGSLAPFVSADDEVNFSAFSGKLGLNYQFNDDLLLYGNLSKGFKTGGFFGGFATDNSQLEPYEAENIYAYEAGFKSDLLEKTLRVNGSAFYYQRTDMQFNAANPSAGISVSRLTNIGDVDSKGAELDITWRATESLLASLSMGYTDTEIVDSDFVTVRSVPFTGSASLEGVNIPYYSKFSSNFLLAHTHDITNGYEGTAQLEWNYRSERDLNLITNPEIEDAIFKEPGYSLVNVRYTLHNYDNNWKVVAYVENALDKEYRAFAKHDGLFGGSEIYGPGMRWGLKFAYQW